jgi:hypothetical protein
MKKKTTCPPTSPRARANVSSARQPAFNISSIERKITIRLRRVKNPTAPIEKRRTATVK